MSLCFADVTLCLALRAKMDNMVFDCGSLECTEYYISSQSYTRYVFAKVSMHFIYRTAP